MRWLGERYPVGQVVFFRSAFAILPVVIIYAWRRELMAAIRIGRPFHHLGRGLTAVGAMFCNFSSLARLPVVDATAISFVSPLITVALSAMFLKERVRIYRWSAVIIGFIGVLVMLAPHLGRQPQHGDDRCRRRRNVRPGRRLLQRLLDRADPLARQERNARPRSCSTSRSSARSPGLCTLPFGWLAPTWKELAALIAIGIFGGLAHIFLTESYRLAEASLVAPFDYTSMLWALLLGYLVFDELPRCAGVRRRCDHCRCRLVRDLARAPARPAARPRRRRPADQRRERQRQNALKVRMVRVSWMPGMVCTFSLTKWPMSVPCCT